MRVSSRGVPSLSCEPLQGRMEKCALTKFHLHYRVTSSHSSPTHLLTSLSKMPTNPTIHIQFLKELLLITTQHLAPRPHRLLQPLHTTKANDRTRNPLPNPSHCNLTHRPVLFFRQIFHAMDDLFVCRSNGGWISDTVYDSRIMAIAVHTLTPLCSH